MDVYQFMDLLLEWVPQKQHKKFNIFVKKGFNATRSHGNSILQWYLMHTQKVDLKLVDIILKQGISINLVNIANLTAIHLLI